MRVHVAFTPAEVVRVPNGIVVDVLRASSTIVQALGSGYRRVLCCALVEEARALRAEVPDAVLAGERSAVTVPGFDLGNSPREFLEPQGETLILSTTNGTRAIVAAARTCEAVYVGSLLNLDAVAGAVRERGGDVDIICAGVEGAFTLDDAYCAGRLVEALGGEETDAARAAVLLARAFPDAEAGLRASENPNLEQIEEDIAWCARLNACPVVPVFTGTRGPAAQVELSREA